MPGGERRGRRGSHGTWNGQVVQRGEGLRLRRPPRGGRGPVRALLRHRGARGSVPGGRGGGGQRSGSLAPDEGGEDLFVRYSAIGGSGLRSLEEGEKVSYEPARGRKG